MNTDPFAHPSTATLINLALHEDDIREDVTSLALVPATANAVAALELREGGVLCGLPLLDAQSPLMRAFPNLHAELLLPEGAHCSTPCDVAVLRGNAREILAIERTLLNFLQRMSGIATATARCVDALAGSVTRVQETRKTCPGWRLLDKYAVRTGGGLSHRSSLSDQVLIKENHVNFCGARLEAVSTALAVRRARERWPKLVIEVEVETEAQFEAVLHEKPEVVMLDGFGLDAIRRCVALRNRNALGVLLEVSGGITLDRLAAIGACGVDRVSIGALTHSVKALDLALKIRAIETP